MATTLQNKPFPTVQRDDAEAFQFFDALKQTFAQASWVGLEVQQRDYAIAGLRLRLCFAGTALVPSMVPALEHLSTSAPGVPDLTVHLWDTASTGLVPPAPPWSDDPYAYGSHGEVWGYNPENIRIIFNMFFDALSVLNLRQNEAIFWVKDVVKIPFWETAAPLRILLHWWLGSRGLHYVHGAVVGIPEAGALLVGKGGSGKSTTALTCLDSDLVYVSDDYCLLSEVPAPRAFSLYNSAKLKPDNTLLPHLMPLVHNQTRQPEEKPFIFLHQHFPKKLVSDLPLKMILVPQVTGASTTTLQPVSAAIALLALAPSTIFQLPGGTSAKFKEMANLVKQIPCYTLALGTDLSQIPQVITNALEAVV